MRGVGVYHLGTFPKCQRSPEPRWFAAYCQKRFAWRSRVDIPLLLRAGVHPKLVAERLGHSRVATTLDVYSYVLPNTQREAVKALEGVFG